MSQPKWAREAQEQMARVDVEMERLYPRWHRMSFTTKAYFLANAKRCYEADPVQFKHFEDIVMVEITVKLGS
jgi:hypothetical protein